jgi:hypothetical protein
MYWHVKLVRTNVCRVIGSLLSFGYTFGWVARQCSLLAPKCRHFGPTSLPPE